MDDGDPSLSDKEEGENDEEDTPLLRVPLVDAPILLFVCFHKAFRSELDHLRRLAETASSLEDEPRRCRQIVLQLQRRFQFLKLAHKYHCAAEDEVSFSYIYALFIWLLGSVWFNYTSSIWNESFKTWCGSHTTTLYFNSNISPLFISIHFSLNRP